MIAEGLFDTHCHLDFEVFEKDRKVVIDRAQQSGVSLIVNPGIDVNSSKVAIELSKQYEPVYSAIGVHPNSENVLNTDDWISQIRGLSNQPKVVAIGEIGLDYYRKTNSSVYQKDIFKLQLDLARETELPVIIHSREAGNDMIEILSEWVETLKFSNSPLQRTAGVLHSFSDNKNIAQQAIEFGFYIGITGPITFKNANDLRATIASIPLERLVLETDAPFLSPQPMRGQRNEPRNINIIAEKIAEIYNFPLERVIKQTTLNAKTVFRLRD